VGYLSIIVLIPIAAVVARGLGISVDTNGAGLRLWDWSVHLNLHAFWTAVTEPAALHAIWLSLWLSLAVAGLNAVAGIAIAWILVRDDFAGKRFVEGFIDLPFALPTIVAGVVFIYLYGEASPIHVTLFETWIGLFVALAFVTLPFSVRAVQPVLESLDGHAEAAARSLGATRLGAFRSVVLPSIVPAVLSGFGLAFARALGEFGSISLIAGGLQRTTTASYYIFNLMSDGSSYFTDQAAAVSVALLVLSLVLLVGSSALSRHYTRRLTA
jgi:sulfate transport system permease protein